MSIPAPSHLDPSELGTKEYWDAAYATELSNHAADASDTGHVWFAESDAEGRVAAYLARLADEAALSAADTTFLDLGTGNGSMLRALRADGWAADMLGVDYSEDSVALARRTGAEAKGWRDDAGEDGNEDDVTGEGDEGDEMENGEEEEKEPARPQAPAPRFEVWDLIRGEYEPWIWARLAGGSSSATPAAAATAADASDAESECRPWDVVLDKGTFDAISLSDERDEQGRRIVETYRERVKPLVARNKGMLLITSCNWTEEELERWFVRPGEAGDEDGGFVLRGRVKYPTFRFGGKEGQAISSVCFRRT